MTHVCSGICVDVGVLLSADAGAVPSKIDLSLSIVLSQDSFDDFCRFLISDGKMG